MRRIASVVLLIIGAWMLACGVMVAGLDFGDGGVRQLAPAGVMAGVALPFLLLGGLASPGNRFSDLGITLTISAAVGGALVLMMWQTWSDPKFRQMMPPDKPLPNIQFALVPGFGAVLIIAGLGFGLWWLGRHRAQRQKPDLEAIFGDE